MSSSWAHICGLAGLTPASWPVVPALLLAGLGGSVTHCLTMCSVFILGQQPSGSSAWARLLLPYHAGRITTYAALGAAAGAGFGLFASTGVFPVVRHLILALTAVLFLFILAERLMARAGVRLPLRLGAGMVIGGGKTCSLTAMGRVQAPLKRYGLGLAMGFLPCPMVLAATAAAGTTASPRLGALAMLAFGLGTAPALLGLAFARGNLLNSSPRVRDNLTLAALGLNSVILLTLAVGTGTTGA